VWRFDCCLSACSFSFTFSTCLSWLASVCCMCWGGTLTGQWLYWPHIGWRLQRQRGRAREEGERPAELVYSCLFFPWTRRVVFCCLLVCLVLSLALALSLCFLVRIRRFVLALFERTDDKNMANIVFDDPDVGHKRLTRKRSTKLWPLLLGIDHLLLGFAFALVFVWRSLFSSYTSKSL